MKVFTPWLRSYLPTLPVDDRQLADDLTLRGIAVDGVFDAPSGSVFEMDITTNRVDAMNHYGIAREAATLYGVPLAPLEVPLPQAQPGPLFPVRIEAPEFCGRFTARVLKGVSIDGSGGVVAEYFAALGQKPISSAVDATNYVWLAMGQPTHAFDLDKLEGGIVVRRARQGEKLKTLDGVERTLEADDLVVADEKKALALAGVMGGWDSMITPATRNVLVESAWFDPAVIRRTSRRHGIHTDASHRYERGADFNAAPVASALVSRLILERGGSLVGELNDVIVPEAQARTAARPPVSLSLTQVHRLLGTTTEPGGLSVERVTAILTGLGCALAPAGEAEWQVTLPSWRLDLEREIDLIEEIARVYGYNGFANTLPSYIGAVVQLPYAQQEQAVRTALLAQGLSEALSSTFISAEEAERYAPAAGTSVPLGNPLSEEASCMRTSLVPGMVTALSGNLNRDVTDVALFDLGTTFSTLPTAGAIEQVSERPALAVGLTGSWLRSLLHGSREVDFYDLKGVVEQVLARFALRTVAFDAFPPAAGLLPQWLVPGRAARVTGDGLTLGYLGQLNAEGKKLRQPVYVAELYLDRLYRTRLRTPAAREFSRYQAVRRDFSLVVPGAVSWAAMEEALAPLAIAELTRLEPVDLYAKAEDGGKAYSLLLRATFQSQERTLREEELQEWSEQVLAALAPLGIQLRA